MKRCECVDSKEGFTLIELLIVIALLGAFAIGLIATIDPFEQLKKGSDTSRSSSAQSLYNAIIRTYSVRGDTPVTQDIIGAPLSSTQVQTLIQEFIARGELKSTFLSLLQRNASKLFLNATHDGKTLAVCFKPESKSFKLSPQTSFSEVGVSTADCSKTTCYYCIGENVTPLIEKTYSSNSETTSLSPAAPTSIPILTLTPTQTRTPAPTVQPTSANTQTDTPITRNVMVIDFNPILENQGNKRLRAYTHWNDPLSLEAQFIQDITTASGGYLTYKIVERLADLDVYPTKNNGYVFTDPSYISALSSADSNARAIINYNKVLTDYDVCGKVNRGEIDELWLWGGPWFGYWEAVMAGPGAYVTNAPPITGTACTRKLHIFGFSYERGIPEMLEDMGHRAEGTLRTAYGGWFTGQNTDWDKFTKSRSFHQNDGMFSYGCGSIHEPFNSSGAYDWGNATQTPNTCSAWAAFPEAPTAIQTQSCTLWGCSGYGYIKMWLTNMPKATGQTSGRWNNWWKYIADVN